MNANVPPPLPTVKANVPREIGPDPIDEAIKLAVEIPEIAEKVYEFTMSELSADQISATAAHLTTGEMVDEAVFRMGKTMVAAVVRGTKEEPYEPWLSDADWDFLMR